MTKNYTQLSTYILTGILLKFNHPQHLLELDFKKMNSVISKSWFKTKDSSQVDTCPSNLSLNIIYTIVSVYKLNHLSYGCKAHIIIARSIIMMKTTEDNT